MSKKQTSPTDLDFAILGLLHQQAETGYGIRKIFETTALGNYSSSPGSIYPALKRLQKLNLVVQENQLTESGANKSRFLPTPIGTKMLIEWMSQPIVPEDISKSIEQLFLRFAFMDNHLSRAQKLDFLLSFNEQVKTYLTELEAYYQQEADNLPLHGRLAFEHGIATYRTHLKWGKKALVTLQQTKDK
ncbi:MAG: hypothetical protein DHS20C18_46910 [Saprospiraceae bacterium]|nr:MAG: hypothetical protein DHS20C18_46910 [Saprospiraceae bacterium]